MRISDWSSDVCSSDLDVPACTPERSAMDRIVDIATDDLHLSAYRGFLVASLDRQEQGRVALDDIQAVIVHAHGVTWTTSLEIGRAHVCTPVTNAHLVCRPLLEQTKRKSS